MCIYLRTFRDNMYKEIRKIIIGAGTYKNKIINSAGKTTIHIYINKIRLLSVH